MKTVRRFFGWFFLVIGAFGFFQQPIAGLVFLSWGALLLPFTNQLAAKRGLHLDVWKRLGIVVVGIVLVNLTTPRSQLAQSTTQQVTPSSIPNQPAATAPSPTPSSPARTTTTVAPSPESKETSFGALVQKKGLDFSYETSGRVQESDKAIVVTHTRTSECGAEAPVSTQRQEWETVFDLTSKTWTDKVRELSSCLGSATQEWIDYSTTPSQFNIKSNGNETVIRADVQDTDGSIILKDSLVVRYTKP